MDEVRNPFAPGAGVPPPELAGRAQILEDAKIALGRVKQGRAARSKLMLGLRGVGKTVLLNTIEESADREGFLTVMLEAPEDRRLADMLVPPLRRNLFKLSRIEGVREAARRGDR
jgi:predicted AAA+ superfamily ATPase